MRFIKQLLVSFCLLFSCVNCAGQKQPQYTDAELRNAAAQLLIVGFQGAEITPESPIYNDVAELGVGGVVLFDVDLCTQGGVGSRNIQSPEQLVRLTRDLQLAAKTPLLITIDQEGGRVCRLKEAYGFPPTVSAQYLGARNNVDTTRFWSERTASLLAELGINTNFAPSADVNVNPDCPVIGRSRRSFSADPAVVAAQAGAWIDGHHLHGIITAIKHFPGHGSATTDSHNGFTDVTNSWSKIELIPFKELIKNGKADIVMTAHVFNKKLDEDYPATLSKKVLTDILRKKLGFKGVICTDDLYMDAISKHYDQKEAIALTLNAGADMLILGNNSPDGYAQNRPSETVDIIVELVKEGKVPYSRIQEANERIAALKERIAKK